MLSIGCYRRTETQEKQFIEKYCSPAANQLNTESTAIRFLPNLMRLYRIISQNLSAPTRTWTSGLSADFESAISENFCEKASSIQLSGTANGAPEIISVTKTSNLILYPLFLFLRSTDTTSYNLLLAFSMSELGFVLSKHTEW
ncbi:hypothetical protein JTE90_014458 [Oedothorax gibbosus]|uniref:Uncharacterized protein n=1 Tax=Oedothorax gibbosus TaxID=931172 RepID=A0AAV6VIU5_9ARAC|nr:hypothetical protein JTE90_014458 [Oedothorax gibbosus]